MHASGKERHDVLFLKTESGIKSARCLKMTIHVVCILIHMYPNKSNAIVSNINFIEIPHWTPIVVLKATLLYQVGAGRAGGVEFGPGNSAPPLPSTDFYPFSDTNKS